ncbi:MAG TPA: malectin domain-containing carbohydrate-binding protein [Candidatus Sulfotelmatobacter sp.]|nr:malectin domain-containing carbohydrate-binding protein [Candidatus Sulfotelmatobacter sp.]
MPSIAAESVSWEAERAELQTVLQAPIFVRSPALSHLLSYLCEKTFAGETDQIKEYSIALDVFDRRDSFDQDTDSIVRVEANRLRKRLAEYYSREGARDPIRITIPVGQYVPAFQKIVPPIAIADAQTGQPEPQPAALTAAWYRRSWLIAGAFALLVAVIASAFLLRERYQPRPIVIPASPAPSEPTVGLPVGEELHILAGSTRKYVDHAGKVWGPDAYFTGGRAVASSVQHIWRTQDPIIYRSSRHGNFAYNIPLKPGTYELRLHFAENFYGPESSGGGGEGSRTVTVSANGQILLRDFDVLADAGGERTAEVKVFPNISPTGDGQLHLAFSSGHGGSAMVSAIEILPGIRDRIRPVRIVARDVPYYSDDSRWWSPDTYFKGGQLRASQVPALGTDDPEFYETERWGHFSYSIPVAPGRYSVTLHFIDHNAPAAERSDASVPSPASEDRTFNVFCNGKTILSNVNIVDKVGRNRPLLWKIKGLEPNAQGKLLLEFVPVTRYATVSAIEVVAE